MKKTSAAPKIKTSFFNGLVCSPSFRSGTACISSVTEDLIEKPINFVYFEGRFHKVMTKNKTSLKAMFWSFSFILDYLEGRFMVA